jgi:hypothetical protein
MRHDAECRQVPKLASEGSDSSGIDPDIAPITRAYKLRQQQRANWPGLLAPTTLTKIGQLSLPANNHSVAILARPIQFLRIPGFHQPERCIRVILSERMML